MQNMKIQPNRLNWSIILHTKTLSTHNMSNVIPFAAVTLQERVAQQLRQMLIEGEIAPGAKLNERELAERLSTAAIPISRTPLREAIRPERSRRDCGAVV
jgi:hypothetical protein